MTACIPHSSTTPKRGTTYELNSEEVAAIRYRESDQCIINLAEALEVCREYELGVMLDLKSFGPAHSDEYFLRIADLVRAYELSEARPVLQKFLG